MVVSNTAKPAGTARPFHIEVPEHDLRDLLERVRRARFPDQVEAPAWTYGTDLSYMRDLARYWVESFDWRAQEARLNEFRHHRMMLGDLDVHFVHAPGRGPDPMPLVLSHGWPSTFYELHKIISPLADPEAHGGDPGDAFHVVVPSLPGYGFTSASKQPGMSPRRVASVWAELMAGLGYERFGAHGGDWGAYVTALLGLDHAERLIGIHMTMVTLARSLRTEPATPDQQAARAAARRFREEETGYQSIQGTRPQTLGYGLSDSPVGLAAWIIEKWRAWSDCDGDVEKRFTKDELLTTVCLYWFTNTINSSIRLYYEARRDPVVIPDGQKIDPPAGFAMFRSDPGRPRLEQVYDVARYTVLDRGGHFAAMEEPDLLVEEIRAFFRPLRDQR